jgi:hypothetical protein
MKRYYELHFSIALLALTALPAQAEIFKCTETDGHVTYSNVANKNCKALNLEPVSSGSKAAPKTASPSTFPRVNDTTQRARDTERRRILETELAAEQKNLEQAKKELAEQEAIRNGDERNYQKMLDRLRPLQDKVALHERNIEAIKKEISNLR